MRIRASKQYSLSSVDERLQEWSLLAVSEAALFELAQYLLGPRFYLRDIDVLPFAVEPLEVYFRGLFLVNGFNVVQGDRVLESRLVRFCLSAGLVLLVDEYVLFGIRVFEFLIEFLFLCFQVSDYFRVFLCAVRKIFRKFQQVVHVFCRYIYVFRGFWNWIGVLHGDLFTPLVNEVHIQLFESIFLAVILLFWGIRLFRLICGRSFRAFLFYFLVFLLFDHIGALLFSKLLRNLCSLTRQRDGLCAFVLGFF